MRQRPALWTLLSTTFGVVVGAIVAFGAMQAPLVRAQAPPSDHSIAAELIGAVVITGDGTQVGTVSAVSTHADGEISEIRITTSSPLGLGHRVVVLPPGDYVVLRGAVVLDLSPEEVDALPSTSSDGPRT